METEERSSDGGSTRRMTAATSPAIAHGADKSSACRGHPINAATPLNLPHPRQGRKRLLGMSEDPTEALLDQVKKCRVSSTPGELRLKRDLVDCDLLRRQGIARFDKTAGDPLKCQLTFLCPIGALGVSPPPQVVAAAAGARVASGGVSAAGSVACSSSSSSRGVPTTFSVIVPKFYPHEPPLLYAERCFSRTCSFVGEDGLLDLPFLSRGVWSSVSTMALVTEALLEGLRSYAAGDPRPWGAPEELGQDQSSPGGKVVAPVAFLACASMNNEPPQVTPRVGDDGAGHGGEGGGAGAARRCQGVQVYGGGGAAVVGCFGEVSFERGSFDAARNSSSRSSSSSSSGDCCKAVRRSGDTAQSMDVVDSSL
ncbi:unnamed protein product [Pylaiella littoralis]